MTFLAFEIFRGMIGRINPIDPSSEGDFLLEDGSFLLLEDGENLNLEAVA